MNIAPYGEVRLNMNSRLTLRDPAATPAADGGGSQSADPASDKGQPR